MDLDAFTRYPCFEREHDFDTPLVVRTAELLALERQPDLGLGQGRVRFQKRAVDYTARFFMAEVDPRRPAVVIPTRDQLPLLARTLENLARFQVTRQGNVMVVDDRSVQGADVKSLCARHGVSCVRVDNHKGFNFSMLVNLAAHCAHQLGCAELVLWNDDLWAPCPGALPDLLSAHRMGGHTITGTRLLYPAEGRDGVPGGTVQFGGSAFTPHAVLPGQQTYVPRHAFRMWNADHHWVRCDRPEVFITGAFCIIDLAWFVAEGGLNVSLARTLQDVDLCLRANEQQRKVIYLGRQHHLIHAEGTSLRSDVQGLEDRQFASDALLYSKLWPAERVAAVMGIRHS